MKVTVELNVDRLPENRMLAFHQGIGQAYIEDREYEITRSPSGMNLAFHRKGVIHTLNLNGAIQAALEAIIAADFKADVVPGSEEDLVRKEVGL